MKLKKKDWSTTAKLNEGMMQRSNYCNCNIYKRFYFSDWPEFCREVCFEVYGGFLFVLQIYELIQLFVKIVWLVFFLLRPKHARERKKLYVGGFTEKPSRDSEIIVSERPCDQIKLPMWAFSLGVLRDHVGWSHFGAPSYEYKTPMVPISRLESPTS